MQIRECFIKPKAKNIAICGKCGSRVAQDSYQYRMHAASCNFSKNDLPVLMREDEPGSYMLQAKEDGLHFMILAVSAIPDKKVNTRYTGGKWVCVFHSVFPKNEKKVVQISKGYKDTLSWIKTISDKALPALHTSADEEVIKRVFPGFTGLYSLEMFYSIFTERGIRCLSAEKISLLHDFLHYPLERYRILPNAGYKKEPAYLRDRKYNDSVIISDARLYRYAEEEFFILELRLPDRDKKSNRKTIKALAGRDLFLCDELSDIRFVLTDTFTSSYQPDAVFEFDRTHPTCHLGDYLKNGGRNLLLPLVGAPYHKVYELLCGASLSRIADRTDFNASVMFKGPDSYRNIKDLYHLPPKVLRKIEHWPLTEDNLKVLAGVLKTNPEYLNLNKINLDQIVFFRENRIGAGPGGRRRRRNPFEFDYPIACINSLSSKDILKIVRYLSDPGHSYSLLRDYLNITEELGERPDGITPKNLTLAHDVAMQRYRIRENAEAYTRFSKTVSTPEYLSLTTVSNPLSIDELMACQSPYIVMAPVMAEDLIQESQNMRNCVRTYIQSVAAQRTRVYFLRKASDPFKSFVTIEVRSMCLIQVKAFGNARTDKEVQKFVAGWARAKGISYETCPDMTFH